MVAGSPALRRTLFPLTFTRRIARDFKTPTRQICVQRFSVVSSKPFKDVIVRLEEAIGRPDMTSFSKNLAAAHTENELERVGDEAVGPSGLMEFARFDLGGVLRKELSEQSPSSLRFVVGNPVSMKELVRHAPDAGSYAPVTILVDERADGVHLCYDTMASFLVSCGSRQALQVAEDLDFKVKSLLTAAAG